MGFRKVKWKSLLLGFGCALFLTLGLVLVGLPSVVVLKSHYPVVEYRGPKTPPQVKLTPKAPSGWVMLREISKGAIGAVVVSEDALFFQHPGYDLEQIKNALEESVEAGHLVRGASTITQQVVRNVFLDKERRVLRKLKELYLAVRLEKTIGKRKILEIYMNIAEWGEGIFGIRSAARHYFGKSPLELTAKEGAFLAMLLPSPKRYSLSFRVKRLTGYAQGTVDSILEKMAMVHYISREELERERSRLLPFEEVLRGTESGQEI